MRHMILISLLMGAGCTNDNGTTKTTEATASGKKNQTALKSIKKR